MDFKSMKRRELQALCKKHGLPANSTNSQMALSLVSLLQNPQTIMSRGCLKGSGESVLEDSEAMDFKSMKRRELQALCKKHGLPANSTNSQMALSLASLLQNPQRIKSRGCLKGSGESVREDSGPKKVSFVLEEEKFEFEKSLGKPETRRSTRRDSIGVLKASEQKASSAETSPRVPDVPARITRSRDLEVVPKNMELNLSASQGSEDLECDLKEKRKESCVVESNVRSLRSRLVVGGNEGRSRRNQKQGRSRRNAGKQEEDNVDAFLNLKLGEGEVFEKKNSWKRLRVADVQEESEEAPPCEEPQLRRSKRSSNGNMRSETTEVDDRADDKVPQCGVLPARRPKCNLLKPETVVFDAGMVKEVEALPKRSRLSAINDNVTENVVCSITKGKSGDECETVGRHKRTKRTSKQVMKRKAPIVSEAACEFTTESATSEVHGEPAERPEFRVSSQRLTRTLSKRNESELVSLPTSGKLINKKITTRTTRPRKQQGKRGSSEGPPPTGETESTHGSLEVQGESKIVVQCEELPLHPNRNTWKTSAVECEATEGFKPQPQQTDEVTIGTGSIASPSTNSESEALAIPTPKTAQKRSSCHTTKNEACTTSVLQAVSDEIVKKKETTRSSEGPPPKGETESTHGAFEVQGEAKIVVQCEELPLHPNRNTWKTGAVECEATEGFKPQPQQTDEVTIGTGSIASPSTNSESEALAIPTPKTAQKRSTCHTTKNEAYTTSVLQAVSDEIVKKKETTTKRPRAAVLDDDVSYAESETCGGFPHMRNQENGILIDGDDKKPGSHVTTARRGMNCRKVNSLDEALQSECSPDLLLSLFEDSYQDTLAGKCLARNVSRKNHTSQSLQSIGKMSMNKQQNFGDNVDEKIGNDIESHKCLGDQVCLVHEDQVMISGSSEVMDLSEALEVSPCFAVQGSCTKNEDEEKISEARHPLLVDTLHAALSTYTDELSGSSEKVNEVVRNPQMDDLLAFEQTTIAFALGSVCVEQVDTTEFGHKVLDTVSTPVAVADHCGFVGDAIHNEDDSELKELSYSVGGVSLTYKEIGKFTAAVGTEVSSGTDQEEPVMVANLLGSKEITSHLPGVSNDTHTNSADSSDLHSGPSKDVGMVEAAPISVFQLATEIFSDAEEIKEEDKDSTDSCPRILVLEEHEETMMPENKSLSVAFKEDVTEGVGDQMKQSLIIDRFASDHFPSMSSQKTTKSLSCLEIPHDGSSSHNNVIATCPEVGIFENMETYASEHEEAQTVEKETNLEMLDDMDARKHSEMEGDSNVSLEERFCEDTISLLSPAFVIPLNKQDEDLEMAAMDVELPLLTENVACEVEHKSEKASRLNTRVDAEGEDKATSESQLQMDHKHATLLRFDSNKIYSKSGIQKIMLEDVGMNLPACGKIEDVSETNADSCCEDSERDNKGTKLSSIDLVTHSCIFGKEASAVTVAEFFQQSDFEEPSSQTDIHGADAMNLHQNWHSTVVSIDIPEPEIQSSSYFQNDLENKTEALSMFIRDNATVFVDDSRTCKTSPGNLENCTTDRLPVDLEKAGVDSAGCHHDDEKVTQVRNSTVTDNLDFELCPAGLMQQHIDKEPDEDNLKVVFDSIDACMSIKQNPIIYNLAVGGVSEELENSNVNTTVGVDRNQISAFPCKFHEGQECVSPSAVNDQKPVEETKACEFKSLVMNADEITKHNFAAAFDDMNKESLGLSIDDVIGHEDGNETIAGLEENADRYDNNNGVQNFNMGSEPASSEVSADGVKIVARQFNNENQDGMKSSMVRFDSDNTEGAQVDNDEAWVDRNEINLILNNCEIFVDSEDANGCKGENFPAAYMVEEEECSLDITKSEGALAESELGGGPSMGRLVSVSREQFSVNCSDAWNVDVVDEAVSGKQDQEEINSIEHEACNSTRKAAALKHEVEGITYAGIPDLNDHEGSSRSKYLEPLNVNIKGMEDKETNICGIRDCLHEMENSCLEDSKNEENNHETEYQGIPYPNDHEGSSKSKYLESLNVNIKGMENEANICRIQDCLHEMENTCLEDSNIEENNHEMECQGIPDPNDHEGSSKSKYLESLNVNIKGMENDETNNCGIQDCLHEMKNTCLEVSKIEENNHETECQGITYAGSPDPNPDPNDHEGSSKSKYLESLNVNIKDMENEETNICGIQDCLHEMENTCLLDSKIEENNHETECQVMAAADNKIGKWIDAGSPPASEISDKQAPSPESQHHFGKENLFGSAYSKSTDDLGSQALDLYHDKRKSFEEANFLKADSEKAPEDFCSEPDELVGVEKMFSATEFKEQDGGKHKLIHETSVVVASKSDETEFNSDSDGMTKSGYKMEETTVTLIQSSITEETVSVSGKSCAEIAGQFASADSDQVEESNHEENPLVSWDDCSPKISNHMNTDVSWIESIRSSELHLLDEINHKLINFNISSANKFKKNQIHGAPIQFVDALRPKIQISELKNKENTPILKVDHTAKRTAEKSRRPLQGLQNNELVRQK